VSDSIAPLDPEKAYLLHDLFMKEPFLKLLGDKETVTQLLAPFGEQVRAQCELVFPLDVRIPEEFSKGDKMRIAEWGNAIKNKLWKNNSPLPEHIKECIEEMAELGYYADNDYLKGR
jgi:hypothetical protein